MDYFNHNVILNFLPSFLLIVFLFLSSLSTSLYLENKKVLKKNLLNPIIIFFFTFGLIASALNYLVLFDIVNYYSILLVLIIIVLISFYNLIIFRNVKISHLFINFKNLKKIEKYLLFLLFIYFIISLFPASDADSLTYHLLLPNLLIENNHFPESSNQVIFRVFSSSETLLIISNFLKSDNFGSILNFFTIFAISIYFLKKNNYLTLLFILSSPLMIFFVSTQKLQIFFGLIYLTLIILIYEKKYLNLFYLFLISFLLVFYTSGKLNYIIFAIPLFFLIIYKLKKINLIKQFILYCTISFLVIYFPILLKKFILYGDPFSPFLEFLKAESNQLVNQYAIALRSSEGWLNQGYSEDYTNFFNTLLRLLVPLKTVHLSGSLGLGFILIVFFPIFKKFKEFYLIILISSFMIISSGQLVPRYFLEAFLVISYFFSMYKNHIFIKYFSGIIFLQSFAIFIFGLLFIAISFKYLYPFTNKENFQKRFSFTYYNSKQIEYLNLKGNILNLDEGRKTIFFPKNLFAARNINIWKDEKNKKEFFIRFIKDNKINYIISVKKDNLYFKSKKIFPTCLKTKQIGTVNHMPVSRNFLTELKTQKLKVFEIIKNSCI